MTTPSATTYETRFYRLDEFITLHEFALPQIVKVGKGFYGTSVNRSVETGEILIIFKVEGKKKIVAQHLSSRREMCFPRTCNLTVEMAAESSQDVHSSLETVFAFSPGKENTILMFPNTLNISVAQYMPQNDFLFCSGAEYKLLINAIENDELLHDKLNADCVYLTSDPVRSYFLEMLQFISFPFDKKQRIVPTTENRVASGLKQDVIVTEDGFCQRGFDSPAQPQKDTFASDGIQPSNFSENEVPPLPPKMTLLTTQCHISSSKKDQVYDTESKRENETHRNSFEIHGKQEALTCCLQDNFHDHSLFKPRDQSRENKAPLQPRSKQRDATSKMQIVDDSFSESEETILLVSCSERTAYEPQVDVNANVPFTSVLNNKHKQTLGDLLEPTQTASPCNLPRSLPGIKPETTDDDSGPHLPRKPLIFMENDFCQDFTAYTSEKTTTRGQCKVHKMQKDDGSSPEQSDEDNEENNNIDNLDLNSLEKLSDSYSANMQCQGNVDTAERVRREEVKIGEGEHTANGDNPKKRFFHSLTRKSRWFRQDSKSSKKDRGQVIKTASTDVKIPVRYRAASCEDILISSPRDDDFECVLTIQKYLETQEKLSKALVEINRLQKQAANDSQTATKPESKELSNVPRKSSNETGKAWQRKETEVESSKHTQDMFSKQTAIPSQDKVLSSTPSSASDVSGLPVAHCLALQQRDTTWRSQSTQDNHHRLETNSRRLGMSPNRRALAATDAEDYHSGRRENAQDREPRHEDSNKTCSCCRSNFTDAFSVELTESAAKDELKKAILQMNWSEGEWMELTEMVRRKISDANRIDVPYVNLTHHERHANLSIAEPNEESMRRRLDTPPYVNINQGFGRSGAPPYQNIPSDTRLGSGNDVQGLASRSLGKPPIPTPRSVRGSSI